MSLPGRPVCRKLGRQDVKAGDQQPLCTAKACKKKKSHLFIKEGIAGPCLGGRGGEQEAALGSCRWDFIVQ